LVNLWSDPVTRRHCSGSCGEYDMHHFKVKVCGITRPSDAKTVVRLGTDMIGLIMYKRSPRNIGITQAKRIIAEIPATVDRVGVMVEPEIETVLLLREKLRLDYVQLHGKISGKMIISLRKNGLKVIQAFAIKNKSDIALAAKSKADLVLLDTFSQGLHGGSGRVFDWSLSPKNRLPNNLVLAGGINEGNVEKGVERFRPLVVDVNSGVESSPGIKSTRKLKAFMQICNRIRYEI